MWVGIGWDEVADGISLTGFNIPEVPQWKCETVRLLNRDKSLAKSLFLFEFPCNILALPQMHPGFKNGF